MGNICAAHVCNNEFMDAICGWFYLLPGRKPFMQNLLAEYRYLNISMQLPNLFDSQNPQNNNAFIIVKT